MFISALFVTPSISFDMCLFESFLFVSIQFNRPVLFKFPYLLTVHRLFWLILILISKTKKCSNATFTPYPSMHYCPCICTLCAKINGLLERASIVFIICFRFDFKFSRFSFILPSSSKQQNHKIINIRNKYHAQSATMHNCTLRLFKFAASRVACARTYYTICSHARTLTATIRVCVRCVCFCLISRTQ